MKVLSLIAFFGCVVSVSEVHAVKPDPSYTPGETCTESNPDFLEYRYAAHVAVCRRNVNKEKKAEIARLYGNIPQAKWRNFEFDHLIPLNAGGNNSIANIWPQPISEARGKNDLEQQISDGLRAGELTQDQAIQKVRDWIDAH